MKTLYFDARVIQDGRYRSKGLGYYSSFILGVIGSKMGDRIELIVDDSLDPYPELLSRFRRLNFSSAESMNNGVYFCPSLMTHHIFPLTTALEKGLHVAAVLHDIIPLRRPVYEVGTICYTRFKKALDRSREFSLLIANSRATRDDYHSIYQGCSDVIVVRPRSRFAHTEGGSQRTVPATRTKEYILFGLANHQRKNIEICLNVANFFHEVGLDVVATGGIRPNDIVKLVGSPRTSAVQFLPIVSDNDLLAVYENCRAVVVPSFDEGFSMHVLEAHAAGRPVIASDIPAHREQIEDASRLFDPHSPAALIEAYRAIGDSNAPSMRRIDHEAEEKELLNRLELLMA